MTRKQLSDYRTRITDYLTARRLRDALALLRNLSETMMTWETTDEINRLEQSYAYMLRYVAQGSVDPAREEVYHSIVADIYHLMDTLERRALTADVPTLYYQTIRNRNINPGNPFPALVDTYFATTDALSMLMLSPDKGREEYERSRREEAERGIFNYLWTTFPLTAEDEELTRRLLDSPITAESTKQLIASALTMGQIEFFDQRGLMILMDTYDAQPAPVALRALVGIVLTLYRYRNRPLSRQLRNRLEALRETPTWNEDVRTLALELIRTRDTERVNRKIREEVLPEMLKLRPDIMKKINDARESAAEGDEIDLNPEWEDMIRQSGLSDKMKEMGELQMEGADVMMSTFSHLKGYPFFSEIANWFLPFDASHTAVASTARMLGSFSAGILENAAMLCESDKYSFMMSIRDFDDKYRQVVLRQFEEQLEAMGQDGDLAERLLAPELRRTYLLNYLRDFYRFFKLFRRKGEFRDPFRKAINLTLIPTIAPDIDRVDTLRLVAELYFKFGCYEEALDVFRQLIERGEVSAEMFQKAGYCNQKLGRYAEAMDDYSQAELFNADSEWTVRAIATCAKYLGDKEKAYQYYHRLATMRPDDIKVALNEANALVPLGRYTDAVKEYFKVEFLESERGGGRRSWRPLAWCLLMMRDFDRARAYFDRVLSDNPAADDYLNMGHLELALNNFPEALNYYKLCVGQLMAAGDSQADATEKFLAMLNSDEQYLTQIGVSPDIIPLAADMVFYALSE